MGVKLRLGFLPELADIRKNTTKSYRNELSPPRTESVHSFGTFSGWAPFNVSTISIKKSQKRKIRDDPDDASEVGFWPDSSLVSWATMTKHMCGRVDTGHKTRNYTFFLQIKRNHWALGNDQG